MLKILIADDERILLNGLKKILPWDKLNIQICATASKGDEALEKIIHFQPDMVLIDISMPIMTGLEVIKKSRDKNFNGHFIILSGYADFEYAREAMQYNVNYYLTKPLDIESLNSIVLDIKEKIQKEKNSTLTENSGFKNMILEGKEDDVPVDLGLGPFRVIIVKNDEDIYKRVETFLFEEININNNDYFNYFNLDEQFVILCKHKNAISLIEKYRQIKEKETNSQLLFAEGPIVKETSMIKYSYESANFVVCNRFFLTNKINFASETDFPDNFRERGKLKINFTFFKDNIIDCIMIKKEADLNRILIDLYEQLALSNLTIKEIRSFLVDLYLSIQYRLSNKFSKNNLNALENTEIIYFINNYNYLSTILSLINAQFHIFLNDIGTESNQTVIDSITSYIEINFNKDITLDEISRKFNYNSSYIGKLFTKTVGKSFNQFLDTVRINAAKNILRDSDYRIYEVASLVGYNSVDYFYKKFKSIEKISPKMYKDTLSKKSDIIK